MVFLGGSVLADLMKDNPNFWITRSEYEEQGIRCLAKLSGGKWAFLFWDEKTTKFKLCTFRPEVVIFDFLKSVQQFLKVIILMYITLFQELTTINNHDSTLKTTPFWLDLRFSIEITSERSTLLNNNLFLSSKQKSTWLYNYPFSSCIVMLAS